MAKNFKFDSSLTDHRPAEYLYTAFTPVQINENKPNQIQITVTMVREIVSALAGQWKGAKVIFVAWKGLAGGYWVVLLAAQWLWFYGWIRVDQ